jgi:hypothetical protein
MASYIKLVLANLFLNSGTVLGFKVNQQIKAHALQGKSYLLS